MSVKTTAAKTTAAKAESVIKPTAQKAPAKKAGKVEPVAKPGKKVTTAKVVPAPKNISTTRKNVAKPLPKKIDGKIAAPIKAASAKKEAPAKAVVGIAKTITVDQLLNFAKSEKTLSQGGKFVQVLQIESTRKALSFKLSAPVKVNGELVSSVKLSNTDIMLLDAEAAKVFRHIDGGANVTLKFKRI